MVPSCPRPRSPVVGSSALGVLSGHSDYVTCLSAAPASGLLASGGLRGEALLWDMQTLQQILGGSQTVSVQCNASHPPLVARQLGRCGRAGGHLM